MAALLATADLIAPVHPEIDVATLREIFVEAATLLHDGLALEGLDEHDTEIVVNGLCVALASSDPPTAIRAASRTCIEQPGDLHEPRSASASFLIAAGILQV